MGNAEYIKNVNKISLSNMYNVKKNAKIRTLLVSIGLHPLPCRINTTSFTSTVILSNFHFANTTDAECFLSTQCS